MIITIKIFIRTLIILGFKRKSHTNRFDTKNFRVVQNSYTDSVFIHKKYLSKRSDKEFTNLNKAIRYITKSLDLNKDLI